MKLKTSYKHLVQKPQLCSTTVISMVALRKGVWIDQEAVAKKLGIKVTAEVAQAFDEEFIIANSIKEAGYDVQDINTSELNTVLAEHDIPLQAIFNPVSQVADAGFFIKKNMSEDNDIAMLFYLDALGLGEVPWAHYVLISSYDTQTRIVEVCDPEPMRRSHWKAHLDEFVQGMDKRWDGQERGFVVFKNIQTHSL